MSILIELILLMFGFILLSLSLSRHYNKVHNKHSQLSTRTLWIFRVSGYALLLTSIILGINLWGLTLGLVYWFASAMLIALLITLILSFKPHWLSFISAFKK